MLLLESSVRSDASTVTFLLDGREITARHTDTLIEIADRAEALPDSAPVLQGRHGGGGNCRSCMVEIKGRTRAGCLCSAPRSTAWKSPPPASGYSSRNSWSLSCCNPTCRARVHAHNEVDEVGGELKVGKRASRPGPAVTPDYSHAAIAVNLDACIQCTRCVRACRDEQVNE